ncbi:MAG TPA: tetratricopeptide repeat protein [Anaeromyxobacter sp.]|nr:tetratricopeptide repeat protein [Anaeromyxobacter sp.]
MSVDRHQGVELDQAALAEDVDIDPERRRAILIAEASLERWTHWEALGIAWNAPAAAAREAYLDRVKVFHPDRYAGKRLGSFRGRLERVFRRITEARDALADEGRRAAYARKTAPATEFTRLEARRLEDERRGEERRARLARQNPLVARVARVQELVRRGKAAMADGRFSAAANDLGLAIGLDPNNAELAALAAEARRKAGAAKAAELYQKGLEAEIVGNAAAALERYREALEHDPANVRAAAQAAKAALATGDLASARALAAAAMRSGPRTGIAHEALGLVLEAEGNRKEARRALERAVELDPGLDSAKQRLRKLRPFGGLLG